MSTYWQRNLILKRFCKPPIGGQEGEDVEEHRSRKAYAREARPTLSVGIANPHANHMTWRNAHSPSIARAIAGARFSRHLFHGAEELPIGLLLGAVQIGHGTKGVPNG